MSEALNSFRHFSPFCVRFSSYFSRKYPIQLIIKNIGSTPEVLPDEAKANGEGEHSPTKDYKFDSKMSSNLTHQSSNESVTAADDKSVSNDLGSVIMLSDVSASEQPSATNQMNSHFSCKSSKIDWTQTIKPPTNNPCNAVTTFGFFSLLAATARRRIGSDDSPRPASAPLSIRSSSFPTW